MVQSASPWWQGFIEAIERLPRAQQADRLAGLAIELAERGEKAAAALQALRAWQLARQGGRAVASNIVSRALMSVTPRYHAQISTDPLRVATWEAALAQVLTPGMLVFEIGTGSGILAMLAARAGAHVVSCEKDVVLVAIAEETIRRNGLSENIRIVGKAVEDVTQPQDLPRTADILMLDLFGDRLFYFQPFEAIRMARRLARPGAVWMPARVSLETALVDSQHWARIVPDRVAGLDLGPLLDCSSVQATFNPADPAVSLRSPATSIVSAVLPDDLPEPRGVSERTLVSDGGTVNGVAIWLRLELAPGHVLEARPGTAHAEFYAKPSFHAFRKSFDTRPGQAISIRLEWQGRHLHPIELVAGAN